MLETLREYARERLDEAGETDEYGLRHARLYLERLEHNYPEVRGPRHGELVSWFVSEEDNLRAMLDRLSEAAVVEAARAAALLHRWWVSQNAYAEPLMRFAELLARDDIPDQPRARLLVCRGTVQSRAGSPDAMEEAAREILGLAEPGTLNRAWALSMLASAAMERGEIDQAVQRGLQALEAAKPLPALEQAHLRSDVGEVLAESGRTEEARAIARETRRVFLQGQDEVLAAVSEFVLGRYDLYEQRYADTRTTLVSALDTLRLLGHRACEGETLGYLGLAELGLGHRAEAYVCFEEALDIAVGEGPNPTPELLAALGGLALAAGLEQRERAARVRGAVAGLRRTVAFSQLPRLGALERRFEQPLIDALGPEAWEREQAAGAALSLEETIALARSLAAYDDAASPTG